MHRIQRLMLLAASSLGALASAFALGAAEPGLAPARASASEDLTIPAGAPLIVARSGKVKPAEYMRSPLGPEAKGGVIVLEKLENVTLDLHGVVLRGATLQTPLDKLAGFGLVVRDCKNVTIQGGTISGYGACVVVERSSQVVLEGMSFDRWYGMRLLSTVAAENEADWLWPHENDEGQWLARYGAAISFTDCEGPIVRTSRGRHGQNGILLLRCTSALIYDNDFSFLSGWGLAMYRSSKNIVSRNIFDYCV
ncbi:MAG: right-handed parallel beta-helix repeat-containing protein, partial [Planctomycetota bacterium]